jgi:hypothetical protein
MSASDLILAAALLSAPAGTPEPTPPESSWTATRDAIHRVAIDWEVMDERESRYVMATRDDFQADLDLLRKRREELADAPRLADCRRLPPREVVNDFLRFNRAFRKTLEERAQWELDRASLFHSVMQETDRLYRQWDAVRDAQCDFYYVTVRRAALKKLRDAIGGDAFATGHMPPYVPDWRFAAVR